MNSLPSVLAPREAVLTPAGRPTLTMVSHLYLSRRLVREKRMSVSPIFLPSGGARR